MNIADPKYLEHLRDMPTSYLMDLVIDNQEIDTEAIRWVLGERGLTREEIDQRLQRWRDSRWMRPYHVWTAARWATIFNALLVTWVNITGLYDLFTGDHRLRIWLLCLAAGAVLVGFIIGFKLTTHIYHGQKSRLCCGFPCPVGHVELPSGEEVLQDKSILYLGMTGNALVGITLALFPILFLSMLL